MEKNIKKRCLSPFCVQVFSSQSDEGLRREPVFISEDLSIEISHAEGGITILPNTLCITRGEERVSYSPIKKALSHSTEKLRMGALLFFKNS